MSKRGIAATLVILLAAAASLLLVSRSKAPDARDNHRPTAAATTSATPFGKANLESRDSRDASGSSKTVRSADSTIRSEYQRLSELERAALRGDTKAQFNLSTAMRYCASVFAYSQEALEEMEDALRREHLLQSRADCQYFADREKELIAAAFEWEHEALAAGDPGARAMQVFLQAGNGDLRGQEMQEQLRPLLASNDPFVFGIVYLLSTSSEGLTAESAAWHLLACEREGPPDICTLMNSTIAEACSGEVRCGNTNHEVDVARYYEHAHPGLFDAARARYEELKDRLAHERYDDIDLPMSPYQSTSQTSDQPSGE